MPKITTNSIEKVSKQLLKELRDFRKDFKRGLVAVYTALEKRNIDALRAQIKKLKGVK